MFNNLVNIHDCLRIIEKIKEGRGFSLLKKIFGGKEKRVKDAWSHTQSPPVNWWDIPAVKSRFNRLISGDPGTDHRSYVLQKYFSGSQGLNALSPGCGTGGNEMAWAEYGSFSRIDAYDISESRIRSAVEVAAQRGLDRVIRFKAADVRKIDLEPAGYDLVIFEGALHHFGPVKEMLEKVNRSLRDDGILVVFDFIGPSRFQWGRRQLEVVNGLLGVLPRKYRKKYRGGIKRQVDSPGRLRMIFADPSEAVDSANILPALEETFEIMEFKQAGGTVLQLLFSEIAHNFCDLEPEAGEWLDLCFRVEDLLLKSGDLSSDFALVVCRKRL